VLPSTARSMRSIARCTGSTLGNGRRTGKGTGAAGSTTGVTTGSGAANGAGGCRRTSGAGALNPDTLPSTIRLATTASTATAANEMARRPAIPSCSGRGGLESGRAARRVNSSCRTAETKVPSLSCLRMTHIPHGVLLPWRPDESALLVGTERATDVGIVNSIRRVGSYFQLPATGARIVTVGFIA
jgi:hypothetical protein